MLRSAALLQAASHIDATLDLDFTSALPAEVTFARSSAGWYFDAAGALQSASSNTGRFDHDPGTLAGKYMLVEPAATNIFLNSAVGATQAITVSAVAYTLSFYGTGTLTLTGVSTAGPLVGTGATDRVTLTFTPTAGSLTLTVSGSCTNVQLETGSFASSPIVTVGASVTRAAETATVSSLGAWFSATAGTMVAEYSLLGVKATGVQVGALIDDNTNGNRFAIFAVNTAALTAYNVDASSASQAGGTLGSNAAATVYRVGLAWAANNIIAARNGTLGTLDTASTLPTVTQMRLGHRSADQLCGYLRRVRVWSARVPSATLEILTT